MEKRSVLSNDLLACDTVTLSTVLYKVPNFQEGNKSKILEKMWDVGVTGFYMSVHFSQLRF